MDKEEKVLQVFENISENYDAANSRISLGMQSAWKKHLTDAVVKSGAKSILDVCCGTGDISLELAMANLDVTGLDFSPAMLSVAKEKEDEIKELINGNLSWINGDAMKLPFEDKSFDAATISFGLRNTPGYKQVIEEMKRVSRGNVYILDSFVPENKIIYPFYRLYFKTIMPLLGGGSKFKDEYNWLFESTDKFLSPEELSDLLYEAEFAKVVTCKYNFGSCCLLTAFQ